MPSNSSSRRSDERGSDEGGPRRREVVEHLAAQIVWMREELRVYFARLLACYAFPVGQALALLPLVGLLVLAPAEPRGSVRQAGRSPEHVTGNAFLPGAALLRAALLRTGRVGGARLKEQPAAEGESPAPQTGTGEASSLEASLLTTSRRASKPRQSPKGAQIVGAVEAQGRWLEPAGRAVPVRSRDLWLARCIYAETNRPEEQQLVGWVVRNRVETQFRGETTYKGVILDPGQFTPFNGENWPGGRYRNYYLWLHTAAEAPGWKEAIRIAVHVTHAPDSWRPFPLATRHFFSQQSMPGQRWPWWAKGKEPVRVRGSFRPDPMRFRFFAGVGEEV